MSGTNPVATFTPPISTGGGVQNPTQYKANIDGAIAVAQRVIDNFAPRQSSPAAMTITADPGCVFSGTTLTELAAQTSGTITAPTGSNKRIDRLVFNALTGVISIITGTPTTGTPVPPTITSGYMPIAQILLLATSTSITNSMITDERCYWTAPVTAGSITNAQLANMPAVTLKGNNTGSSGAPSDLAAYQVKPLLGVDSPVLSFPFFLGAQWASNTSININCGQLMTQYAGLINDPFPTTGIALVTADLSKNWAAGGNLDTGSLAANTWYYGYGITGGSQQPAYIIYSTSATGPSMPGGYYGCSPIITCFRTDGSSHIMGFIQKGKNYQWMLGSNLAALPNITSGAQTTYAAFSWTAAAPSAIVNTIRLSLAVGANGGTIAMAAPNANYYLITAINALGTTGIQPPLFVGTYPSQNGAGPTWEFIPESTSVYYACTSGTNAALNCLGFTIQG